jgi:hypothetical protein
MKKTSNARRGIAMRGALGAASILTTGVACVALVPAANAATASPAAASKTIAKHYTVSVKPLALASGTTVKAKAVITAPESKVSDWSDQHTINTVVRKGIGGPTTYKSEGYRCSAKMTPHSNGSATTNYTCKLQGADVPTGITLTFGAVLRGDTASG